MKQFDETKWWSSGDIGASTAIIFDNLTTLMFMSLMLQFGFQFPLYIIVKYIIPGTAIGVLVGNMIFIWLSFYLSGQQKKFPTAIPFGIDAPSAIGMVSCVVGPAFMLFKQSMPVDAAAIQAWQVGMGAIFLIGVIKLIFASCVKIIKRYIPKPALLGASGGLAIAIIGFMPLILLFKSPIVGLSSLGIVLMTMYTSNKRPYGIPGITLGVIIGTAIHYVLRYLNLIPAAVITDNISIIYPTLHLNVLENISYAIPYLPIIVPLALLVIFSTISVIESAHTCGDNYRTHHLVIIDAISTLISSLFGGIAQTTPYISFPAYKKLNAKAGFLMINVVVIGIGGCLGMVSAIVSMVPESALAPVMLFIALEIATQGFAQTANQYKVAILCAFLPAIAKLLTVKTQLVSSSANTDFNAITAIGGISEQMAIILLSNGFFIIAVLWGSLLCFIIDNRRTASFVCGVTLSLCSYFGIIHSVFIDGRMYDPATLPAQLAVIPVEISAGYLILAFLSFVFIPKHER